GSTLSIFAPARSTSSEAEATACEKEAASLQKWSMIRPFRKVIVASRQPASKKRSSKPARSGLRPEAMMVNSYALSAISSARFPGPLAELDGHDLPAFAKRVEIVRPVLHHLDALVPILPAGIG